MVDIADIHYATGIRYFREAQLVAWSIVSLFRHTTESHFSQ
jgi:hypothetical protein